MHTPRRFSVPLIRSNVLNFIESSHFRIERDLTIIQFPCFIGEEPMAWKSEMLSSGPVADVPPKVTLQLNELSLPLRSTMGCNSSEGHPSPTQWLLKTKADLQGTVDRGAAQNVPSSGAPDCPVSLQHQSSLPIPFRSRKLVKSIYRAEFSSVLCFSACSLASLSKKTGTVTIALNERWICSKTENYHSLFNLC